ncbi:hypothetical protein Taro_012395, partial [Colocasia esculenta]|nr:hypothetical protein [Colocasia esculenta]
SDDTDLDGTIRVPGQSPELTARLTENLGYPTGELDTTLYTAGGTDLAPLRCGSELDDGRETSSLPSPVGVGVSLASHWLSRELPQHRANQNTCTKAVNNTSNL